MEMNSLPRWLISITDMPLPRQSEHLGGRLLQHFLGQHRGAGAEVEYTHGDTCLRNGAGAASGGRTGGARDTAVAFYQFERRSGAIEFVRQ